MHLGLQDLYLGLPKGEEEGGRGGTKGAVRPGPPVVRVSQISDGTV